MKNTKKENLMKNDLQESLPKRTVRCPSCGKSCQYDASNEFRPFCSARCKNEDIAAWADEKYRVPVQDTAPDSDTENDD